MTAHLLTAQVVADILDVHPETVLRWTRRGEIPARRLPGGQIRFREDEIEEWLDERATPKRGGVQPPPRRASPSRQGYPQGATTTRYEEGEYA